MSVKSLLAIAFVVVAVAAPYAIPGLIGAAAGSMAAIVATAAVEIGISLAANALLGPSTPKMPGSLANGGRDRLYATLDTTAPRKILFGITAGATDVRYQTYTGTNQQYLEEIIGVACHKVNSIYELWFDNEKAWDSTAGVASKYASFLTVDVRTEGTSANGIAIDSVWTSTATLTGCAYIHIKCLLVHDNGSGGNDSPFASGVTSRMTIRCKGALVYDPRLDSTVTGGSGTQRATDQTTWAWNDNGSRNPALQLLFYLLGWEINGKLSVGMGLPPARIDLASFITAANACDESIALNGGGTEPRYRSDGVISESDDRQSVVEQLCSTMNAVLRDAGGKLSLYVLHNDLATPVASFTEDDVAGSLEWNQTPDLSQSFNICRGRRIDPSDNALYQPVDIPEASLTSPDGIDRIDSNDYPLVQSNGQAQRLLRQRLQRNQYQGRLSFTGKPSWWQVSLGDVIQLSHVTYGWTNKLFRVAGQKIRRTGETDMVLIEENAAIYAWDNSEAAAVTAGAPTVYNQPANQPIQSGMNSAAKTSVVINPIADTVIHANSTGTILTGELPRNIGITASIGTSDITTAGAWSVTTTSGVTCTIGSATGIINITAMSATEVFIPVSFTFNGITRTAKVHVIVQNDPPTSSGGGGGTSGTVVTTTTLGNTTGTTYDTTNAVSATLTATAGAAGKVQCSAPVSFKRTPATADGTTGCFGKWQWCVVGGTFADITTEIQDSLAAKTDSASDIPNTAGNVSCTMTKTGLTAGTNYQFRFLWRRRDATGIAENIYRTAGTLTADGTVS